MRIARGSGLGETHGSSSLTLDGFTHSSGCFLGLHVLWRRAGSAARSRDVTGPLAVMDGSADMRAEWMDEERCQERQREIHFVRLATSWLAVMLDYVSCAV